MSQTISGPVVTISEDPNQIALKAIVNGGDGKYIVTVNGRRITDFAKADRRKTIQEIIAGIQGDGDGKAVEAVGAELLAESVDQPASSGKHKRR